MRPHPLPKEAIGNVEACQFAVDNLEEIYSWVRDELKRNPLELSFSHIPYYIVLSNMEEYDAVIELFRSQLPKPKDRGPYRTRRTGNFDD